MTDTKTILRLHALKGAMRSAMRRGLDPYNSADAFARQYHMRAATDYRIKSEAQANALLVRQAG